jgi:RND superfamily putative drug exporter
MTLLGDRAWTLPAWLDRVLPRISLEGELHDEERPPQPTGGDRTPADPGPPGLSNSTHPVRSTP